MSFLGSEVTTKIQFKYYFSDTGSQRLQIWGLRTGGFVNICMRFALKNPSSKISSPRLWEPHLHKQRFQILEKCFHLLFNYFTFLIFEIMI